MNISTVYEVTLWQIFARARALIEDVPRIEL